MPVFRVAAAKVPADLRKSLLQKLKQERQDPSSSGEPMIFEIPVEEPDRIEVLVVWKEWEDVPSTERTSVILDAYEDQRDKLAQAVGVTYEEAMQQQLLPYSIVSRFEGNPRFLRLVYPNGEEAAQRLTDIRNAKLELGGNQRSGETVDLRFPTREMARQALSKLLTKLPNDNWLIIDDTSAVGTSGQ